MSSILEMVKQSLGQGTVDQLSSQVGTDPDTTQRAVGAALPALFGGMAQHAQTDAGAQDIHTAVTSIATPPSDPEPNRSATADQGAGGLLSRILGQHQGQVQDEVAKASGMDPHQAGKVLMFLAPIVIGMMARKHQEQPQATQQSGGLSSILGEASRAAQSQAGSSGSLGGMLGGLLG